MNPCLTALLLLCAVGSSDAPAQTIAITPNPVLIDQSAAIRVTGLPPNAPITLQADLNDGADHPWQSEAQFTTDAQGIVDLTAQAPGKGSYREVSAMGMVWSMRSPSKDAHIYILPGKTQQQQVIHFHLLQDGKPTAAADLVQKFAADDVRRMHVQGSLHGTLFLPPGDGKFPGVLVLGGSEGGAPIARAAWLASHGYAALALAYFHFEGLPPELLNIPLEYFGSALSWMSERPEIDASRLAVMGASRGGELALQLGSMYPQIRAVVAYVPANIRYPSCCQRPFGAPWTWRGQPLAWTSPQNHSQPASAMEAAIAVEMIHGPVLMIGAESDGVWPSADMVRAAADRLHHAHFAYPVVTLIYPHAGHRAGMPQIIPAWHNATRHPVSGVMMDLGGTPEGNAESTLDAIPKVLNFLSQSLQSVPASTVAHADPNPPATQ